MTHADYTFNILMFNILSHFKLTIVTLGLNQLMQNDKSSSDSLVFKVMG